MLNTQDIGLDDVRFWHPLRVAFTDIYELCRDFYDGEPAVKGGEYLSAVKSGKQWGGDREYLPMLTHDQSWQNYEDYRRRAKFLAMYRRTVESLTGAAVREPADVMAPNDILDQLEDVTRRGQSFDGFVADVIREFLILGRAGVFVDIDPEDNLPRWDFIRGDQIINWSDDLIVFQRFSHTLRGQYKAVPSWEWVEIRDDQYTIWEQIDKDGPLTKKSDGQFMATGDKPIKPFIVSSAYAVGQITPQIPPLLSLANLNYNHYLKSADQARALHWLAFATPWLAFNEEGQQDEIKIGPDNVITLPKDGQAGMLETTGNGLDAIANELESIKREAEGLGSRLLTVDTESAQTATAERISASAETASLLSIVVVAEQFLTSVLATHAAFVGSQDDVTVALNRDFTGAAAIMEQQQQQEEITGGDNGKKGTKQSGRDGGSDQQTE